MPRIMDICLGHAFRVSWRQNKEYFLSYLNLVYYTAIRTSLLHLFEKVNAKRRSEKDPIEALKEDPAG